MKKRMAEESKHLANGKKPVVSSANSCIKHYLWGLICHAVSTF